MTETDDFAQESIADIPRPDEWAAVYATILDLAQDHLTEPISITVDCWQDGECRIRAYHHRPGQGEREVLYYHSSEDQIRYGVETSDAVTDERVVRETIKEDTREP